MLELGERLSAFRSRWLKVLLIFSFVFIDDGFAKSKVDFSFDFAKTLGSEFR